METLSHYAAVAILACGSLSVVGGALILVSWVLLKAFQGKKDWHVLILLTAKSLHGKKYNESLVLPALKEWIGESDMRAYSAISFAKQLRPAAEHMFSDHEEEVPHSEIGESAT